MLYKRSGLPEEDEIVLCKVTQIFPNSVFVSLLEFGKPGMVHISEVAPGRIRNLRDFVSIDREIVCKVLRLDREKGHIDLSLRRVNSLQRQQKLDEIKQELKAESIVKNLAKKLNRTFPELYAVLTQKIFQDFSHLYLCFLAVAAGEADLEKLGIEPTLAKELSTIIIEKFRPEKVSLKGEITLKTYHSEGVEKVRSLLQELGKVAPQVTITYLGGGRYKLTIIDSDYKAGEKKLQKVQELLEKFQDKISTASFIREKE